MSLQKIEDAYQFFAKRHVFKYLTVTSGIQLGEHFIVEDACCALPCVLMVIVEIFIYFSSLALVRVSPVVLQVVFAHQIADDGMTLPQIQVVLWVVNSRHFFHGIDFRVFLA